jgi:hypothetical protein
MPYNSMLLLIVISFLFFGGIFCLVMSCIYDNYEERYFSIKKNQSKNTFDDYNDKDSASVIFDE